jgi:hypothetical protein
VAYWEQLGDRIGTAVPPVAVPPATADRVRMRAVRVRPDVVQAIAPVDLDIVLQWLAPLAGGDRFDLIVATNVLVYYDVFEQSLATSPRCCGRAACSSATRRSSRWAASRWSPSGTSTSRWKISPQRPTSRSPRETGSSRTGTGSGITALRVADYRKH